MLLKQSFTCLRNDFVVKSNSIQIKANKEVKLIIRKRNEREWYLLRSVFWVEQLMNDHIIKALEQSGAFHNESLRIDLRYISFIDFSLDHVEVLIVINVFQNSVYYFV